MRHFTLVLAVSIAISSASAVFAKPADLPVGDMSHAGDRSVQIVEIEQERETTPVLVAKGAIDTAFMRRLRF